MKIDVRLEEGNKSWNLSGRKIWKSDKSRLELIKRLSRL